MITDPILYAKLHQTVEALKKTDQRVNDLPHVVVPEQIRDIHEHLKKVDAARPGRDQEIFHIISTETHALGNVLRDLVVLLKDEEEMARRRFNFLVWVQSAIMLAVLGLYFWK